MKTLFLSIAALLCASFVGAQSIDTGSLSDYDLNKPFGFGAGITGGDGGSTVNVSTLADLKSALSGTTAKVIYVDGTITFTGQVKISDVENKTIIGRDGATFANTNHSEDKSESGIITLRGCKNIIIRNITFKGAGAYDIDGSDNLELYGCSNIWVDHCDFQDGVDGNLDCNNGSDNICISWCRFRYLIDPWAGGSGGSNDHRFSNLWGGSDSKTSDEGKLNTTFYCCWWDEGCRERMPRIRFGKVHILDCLFSSSVVSYCVGGGYKSNAYIENCAFTSDKAKKAPWKKAATSGSYTDYNVTITGCVGADDKQEKSGDIEYFTPTYNYTAFEASKVETIVSSSTNGAGATLKFDTSGIQAIKATKENKATYNLSGQQVDSNYQGFVIQGGKKYIQK